MSGEHAMVGEVPSLGTSVPALLQEHAVKAAADITTRNQRVVKGLATKRVVKGLATNRAAANHAPVPVRKPGQANPGPSSSNGDTSAALYLGSSSDSDSDAAYYDASSVLQPRGSLCLPRVILPQGTEGPDPDMSNKDASGTALDNMEQQQHQASGMPPDTILPQPSPPGIEEIEAAVQRLGLRRHTLAASTPMLPLMEKAAVQDKPETSSSYTSFKPWQPAEEDDDEATSDREDATAAASTSCTPPATALAPTTASLDDSQKVLNVSNDAQEPWHMHASHFFLLSSSGKPIYSHHGSEQALAGLAALITAILSVVEDQGDTLQSIRSGGTLIVCVTKGPLHLVATTNLDVPVLALQRQLELLYLQVVLIVTTGLERIILRNPSYDVRNLLEGTGVVLDALVEGMHTHPAYLLNAIQPLPLPSADRSVSAMLLADAVKQSGAFYGMLMAGDAAIAIERGKHLAPLHPLDLLLIANFVTSNPSYRYGPGESFCPICLPHYNSTAFLHGYINFLDPQSGVYVVLLAGTSEAFYQLRDARVALQQHLAASGVLPRLWSLLARRPEGRIMVDDLPRPLGGMFGETPLWHFLLKLPGRRQVLVSGFSAPFIARKAEVTRAYAQLNSLAFNSPAGGRPNKLVWQASDQHVMLASIDKDIEAFLMLDPLTDKATGLRVLDALKRHFQDKQHMADTFL